MVPKTSPSNEVYLLNLNDDGSPKVAREYIYISTHSNEPFTLRFVIEGTSAICRHGSLWVNIPEQDVEFRRDKFREFK
jgi:glycogen debranching enzyme